MDFKFNNLGILKDELFISIYLQIAIIVMEIIIKYFNQKLSLCKIHKKVIKIIYTRGEIFCKRSILKHLILQRYKGMFRKFRPVDLVDLF